MKQRQAKRKFISDDASSETREFMQECRPKIDTDYAKRIRLQTRAELLNSHPSDEPKITINRMSDDECDSSQLVISYSFAATPFGNIMIASTSKGICSVEFCDDRITAVKNLNDSFPKAILREATNDVHQHVAALFCKGRCNMGEIKLHVRANEFRMRVWNVLLRIPFGGLASYSDIAAAIGNQRAARAVGSAVGDNPVALIIPCHRVILSTGQPGSYRWGDTRKAAIIAWEADTLCRLSD